MWVCVLLWDLSGWLNSIHPDLPVSPASQYHLSCLASCCARQAHFCFSSSLILNVSHLYPHLFFFCYYFEILVSPFPYRPIFVFLWLQWPSPMSASGTNLAAWFLERPNSRTHNSGNVCVYMCVSLWKWEKKGYWSLRYSYKYPDT